MDRKGLKPCADQLVLNIKTFLCQREFATEYFKNGQLSFISLKYVLVLHKFCSHANLVRL